MIPPLHVVLSALTFAAVVLPVALTVWVLFRASQSWRSWLIYSPAGAPAAASASPSLGISDLRAVEARPDRRRPRSVPAHGRAAQRGERSMNRPHAASRGAT